MQRFCWSRDREDHRHFPLQAIGRIILLDFQITASLEIEPEPLGQAKVPGQAQRRVRTDGPLALHDLVDAARGNADVLGKPILADAIGSRNSSSRISPGWIGGRLGVFDMFMLGVSGVLLRGVSILRCGLLLRVSARDLSYRTQPTGK